MDAPDLVATRVSPETTSKIRPFAERQQRSESALLRQLLYLATRDARDPEAHALRSSRRRLRGSRVNLRLNSDDLMLLMQRAQARDMPLATFVAVVIRAYLRDPSLPC